MKSAFLNRGRALPIALAVGIAASVGGIGTLLASDHQDTPEVELNPRMDINDVYAFPSATSADRIVLIMTTSSPIAGQAGSFDPNLLYQLKIDNGGDANEDLVFQITFNTGQGAAQRVKVVGPIAPTIVGTQAVLVNSSTAVEGPVGTNLGSDTGVQVFAGLRADPFFIDLEQFFSILPDRRPSTGALSGPSTPTAAAFRNPGVDFLRPFNALAIVIELPKSMLVSSTATDAKFGLWGTISR
jgi:hypothetical protein